MHSPRENDDFFGEPQEEDHDPPQLSITAALKLAYSLGQTYWQQADSESYSQNKKAEATEAKFKELCAAMAVLEAVAR